MKQEIIHNKKERGFTIVEMMVAVALFAIVMIVAVGALLSLVTANRKAQALQSVMNNLNTTVDSMVRQIREGNIYHCGTSPSSDITSTQDCNNGDTYLAFEPHDGTGSAAGKRIYQYVDVASDASCGIGYTGGCIMRSISGGAPGTWTPVTAPEVNVTSMTFYVVGTAIGQSPTDTVQPKVVVVIKGVAGGTNTKITSTFHIQATAVQRLLDI